MDKTRLAGKIISLAEAGRNGMMVRIDISQLKGLIREAGMDAGSGPVLVGDGKSGIWWSKSGVEDLVERANVRLEERGRRVSVAYGGSGNYVRVVSETAVLPVPRGAD